MQVDSLIEQQAETMNIMKRILHYVLPKDFEDVIDNQWSTEKEIEEACQRLESDKDYCRAMVRLKHFCNIGIVKLSLSQGVKQEKRRFVY